MRLHFAQDGEPLPPGWRSVCTRYLCQIETGTSDTVDAVPDGDYPFFVRSPIVERASTFTHDTEAVFTAGDGAGVGKIFHHYSGKFLAHQRVYVFSDFKRCLPRYFYYYMSTLFGPKVLAGTAKSTVESLRRPMLADFPIALPESGQQQSIVDFLDRETAQIDAMIDAQQRLVRLLEERRVAVVTQLIEAEETSIQGTRLKHHLQSVRQGWSPQCHPYPRSDESEWAVLRTGCVNGGHFNPDDNKVLPDELTPRCDTVVRRGEVVISRANTRDLVGSAAVVIQDHPRLMLSDKLYALALHERANPDFVSAVLAGPRHRDLIELAASGASHSMQNISQADILNLPMGLPSRSDQDSAIAKARTLTARMRALSRVANESIDLLRERRAALITAAVTGRLDPRTGVERLDDVLEGVAS